MEILNYQHFYLMGIKGVAMTSLAQILVDAGKKIKGSDVEEDFVTHWQLERLGVKIDQGFDSQLPAETECVIYTSAHQGPQNPQVLAAKEKGLPVYSQAEAVAQFFNQKKGLAVCGVGGKSTVSAMITWIMSQTDLEPSFSVGVGGIVGMSKTGQWKEESEYFVCEADEYVTDPELARDGLNFNPRFSYLKPYLTVCTNLKFDHPDVYRDLDHTEQTFRNFFENIQDQGFLIINGDDDNILAALDEPALQQRIEDHILNLISFGQKATNDWQLTEYRVETGYSLSKIKFLEEDYQLKLKIPGKYNALNALAAIASCAHVGIKPEESILALADFQSTKRRFEQVGVKDGITYYDDYAHHPHEVKQTIEALKQWHPHQKRVIAFQPHTYSRTKKLFEEFVEALGTAEHVFLIDIFSSAREKYDPTVSSDKLSQAVKEKYPQVQISNLQTIKSLADFCHNQLERDDVLITIGAGDIYKVHQLIET